jgi:hypothetical protein
VATKDKLMTEKDEEIAAKKKEFEAQDQELLDWKARESTQAENWRMREQSSKKIKEKLTQQK